MTTVYSLQLALCLLSAEDYDELGDVSVDKVSSNGAVDYGDDAQGQREGHALDERPIRASFSRPDNRPINRRQSWLMF